MFGQLLTSFFQDLFKDRYPAFGRWFFGSELAVLVALMMIAPRQSIPIILILVAFNLFLLRRYLRGFGEDRVPKWTMVQTSIFAIIAGMVLGVVLLIIFAPAMEGEGGSGYEDNVVTEEDNADEWLNDFINDTEQYANDPALNDVDLEALVNELNAQESARRPD